MIITLTILSIFFSFVSGFAKSICDLSEEGKLKWKPKTYWIKSISSINKYQFKNKVIRYLMKTIFVAFTDGWHGSQSVLTWCLILSGVGVGFLSGKYSLYCLFGIAVVYGVRTLIFHLFYNSKLLRK